MLLGLILLEIILCTACNNVFLMLDVVIESFLKVLVKLVKDYVSIGILLKFDNDTYLLITVGFVS